MGACLDVLRGRGSNPAGVTFPIRWPGNDISMPYLAYGGTEFPDPLTSCPGYDAPSGLPIYLMIDPNGPAPNVTAHSFMQGSAPIEHCVFDETRYTNPDSYSQSLGRAVLGMRSAIILMPRNPLTPGASYTVSITTNGQNYTWSFTVESRYRPSITLPGALVQ